jgi:hypothetical protein
LNRDVAVEIRQTASAEQAAAIAAAVERFQAETAPAAAAPEAIGPWQRAALVEGVAAKSIVVDPEGGVRWQS